MLRNEIINEIIEREGGYVNDPSDSGGETNYGITVQVARNNGYNGTMLNMPRKVAFDIYARKYWYSVSGDELALLSEAVTHEVVDTGVNMGTKRAAMFLQRALNVFNKGGDLYNDISVDGVLGRATLGALATYLEFRSEKVLLKALNCLQGAAYIDLAERRAKDEKFVYGWINARVD